MKLSGHLFHDMTSIKWVSAHKEGQEKSGSYDNFKSVGEPDYVKRCYLEQRVGNISLTAGKDLFETKWN